MRRPAIWLELMIDTPTTAGFPKSWTALDIVCNNKAEARRNMVQELLRAREDMTRPRPGVAGQQPLHAAVRTGNRAMVELLLANKADPMRATGKGVVVVRRTGAREHGPHADARGHWGHEWGIP